MASRREFIVTGTSALAFSGAILHLAQGWLGDLRQYAGAGLKRTFGGPLTPPPGQSVTYYVTLSPISPGVRGHAKKLIGQVSRIT